jgi:hypothetical protein
MKLHVHTFTWICGLVGCQPSSVAINFLDHVTKWAPHGAELSHSCCCATRALLCESILGCAHYFAQTIQPVNTIAEGQTKI